MKGRVNTSRYAVLGILSLGPRSGYDIKKLIERSIAHFWSESFGQIYPILRRLAAEGLVARRRERQAGKPDRHVYTLTPRGLAELQQWLARPARPEPFRSELLLKLFLGGRVSVQDSVRQVAQYRAAQAQLLATYAGIEGELAREHAGHPDLPYWRLTLRYGRTRAAAMVSWAEEALGVLGEVRQRRSRKSRNARTAARGHGRKR